jgi:hypothetical protein
MSAHVAGHGFQLPERELGRAVSSIEVSMVTIVYMQIPNDLRYSEMLLCEQNRRVQRDDVDEVLEKGLNSLNKILGRRFGISIANSR